MIPWGRKAVSGLLGGSVCMLTMASASAGDSLVAAARAPLSIPHVQDLELDWRSRKRRADNVESTDFLDMTPGLAPLTWPKNSDMRARIVTPGLRRTPLVGWIAENLYRSKRDSGWCLEVDPGEGEYVVLYRLNLR